MKGEPARLFLCRWSQISIIISLECNYFFSFK